ncbi:hypothetical protein Hanom_Chr17g01534091 [Helianthus anomalus]
MDGVNEPDENGKVSNLLDPDAEKQTFGRKSQKFNYTSFFQSAIFNEKSTDTTPFRRIKWVPALVIDNACNTKSYIINRLRHFC